MKFINIRKHFKNLMKTLNLNNDENDNFVFFHENKIENDCEKSFIFDIVNNDNIFFKIA